MLAGMSEVLQIITTRPTVNTKYIVYLFKFRIKN